MEYRTLGRTGLSVSALGFGGAETGQTHTPADEVSKLLNSALDDGLNVIDTAECYGNGEELIGQTVSHRRNEFHLFTKCGHAADLEGEDWDPAVLKESIDRSLRRLRTDHVDVIHLHSCSEDVLRAGDVIEVLQRAREQGKTRFIGYSGDSTPARYAVESGVFDTLQTSVSIADQEAVDLTLPAAEKAGMGVVAKRPIANAVWVKNGADDSNPYMERLEKLDYPFLKSPPQESVGKALKFTASCPGVSTMIVGTTKPGRWQENAQLLEASELPIHELQAIRERWRQVAPPDWAGQV